MLAVRLQQLKMALRMVINAILDVRVHTRGMTEAEAMRLMVGRGHQEEGEAVGKWRRALLTSTQLSTYYVGWSAVSGLVGDLRLMAPDLSERSPARRGARARLPAAAAPAHPARPVIPGREDGHPLTGQPVSGSTCPSPCWH